MNYLAHTFLSGNDTEILIGNFIADGVRGKQILEYPERIKLGILLHRKIDAFTDAHPVVSESKMRLREKYGKYAPVITDMFYDHFLAANFNLYARESLATFSEKVYTVMQQNMQFMPEKVRNFLPHMIQHNWLLSYAEIKGINQALGGMSRRTTFQSGMETASLELQLNYDLYRDEFQRFFPELIRFTATQIGRSGAFPEINDQII